MQPLATLSRNSLCFDMLRIAQDDDGEPSVGKRLRGLMDLGDEGTRRVDDLQVSRLRGLPHSRAHPVRGEDDGLALGNVFDAVDELEAEVLKLADDDFVVDQLVKTPDVLELQRLGNRGIDAAAHAVRL